MGCCSSASSVAQVRGSRLPAALPDASPAPRRWRPLSPAAPRCPRASLQPAVHSGDPQTCFSLAPVPQVPPRWRRGCQLAATSARPPVHPQLSLAPFRLGLLFQSHLSGPSRPPAGRNNTGASSVLCPRWHPVPSSSGPCASLPISLESPLPHPPAVFCAPRRSTLSTSSSPLFHLIPVSAPLDILSLSLARRPRHQVQVFKRVPQPLHGPLPRSHPLALHPIPPLCLDPGHRGLSAHRRPCGSAGTTLGRRLGTWWVTGALRKLPLCCQCNRRKRCRI